MWGKGLVAAILFFVVAGLLGVTVGMGLYYRSDAYRHHVEDKLSRFFGLPVDIGDVSPHTFTSRAMTRMQIWLPERRAQIFDCPSAIWDSDGAESGNGAAIHVHNPMLQIGSESWQTEDYARVLRASLAHNFDQLNLREVVFHQARIQWVRKELKITVEGVDGIVRFSPTGTGQARFVATSFNGLPVSEAIEINAALAPREEEFLPEVSLKMPTLPLTRLGIESALGGAVTQGSFAGQVTVKPARSGDLVEIHGEASQVLLAEFTRKLAGGPVKGQVDLTIDNARIRGTTLETLRFSGQVRQLDVNSLAPELGLPPIGGELQLRMYDGLYENGVLQRVRGQGDWTGASLDTLTRSLLGRTGVRGQLRITINSLAIVDGELTGGDVDVVASPPPGGTGAITRSLLLDLLQKQLGLSLPERLLPEEVEFVQLGAKLVIKDKRVRILPLPGPVGPALLTARIFGTLVPVLAEVDREFDLQPLFEKLREPLAQFKETVKGRLKAATRPAVGTREGQTPDNRSGPRPVRSTSKPTTPPTAPPG